MLINLREIYDNIFEDIGLQKVIIRQTDFYEE